MHVISCLGSAFLAASTTDGEMKSSPCVKTQSAKDERVIGLDAEVLTDSTGLLEDAPITGVTDIDPLKTAERPFCVPAQAEIPTFIEIESEPLQVDTFV
jgi:hypothetical protein